MGDLPSLGAMLITAPSEHERLYEMAVRLYRLELKPSPGYLLHPWITVRANCETDEITLAAGIRIQRVKTHEPT